MKVHSKYKGLPFPSDIAALVKKYRIPAYPALLMHTLLSAMNVKRRVTWKTIKTMAKEMSVSEKTVERSLKWLQNNHLIRSKQVRKKDGSFSHNEKRFIYSPDGGFAAFTAGHSAVTAHSRLTVPPVSRDGSETFKCINNSITSNRVKEMSQEKQQYRVAVVSEKNSSQEKKQLKAGREEKRENFAKERRREEEVFAEVRELTSHADPERLKKLCGIEAIERQLRYWPYRNKGNMDTPAAWFETAVLRNFSAPKGCLDYYNNEPEPAKPIPYDEGDGLGLAC